MQTVKFFEIGSVSELTQGLPGEEQEDIQDRQPQPE
jgi:hypothetical protein